MKKTKKIRIRKKDKKLIATILSVLVLIISVLTGHTALNTNPDSDTGTTTKVSSAIQSDDNILDAYFIDVGQGDCSLFISDGMSMLIDSGEAEYADTVIKTISDYGVTSIDYVVATHAHSDHIGAMAEIISEIDVKNIIISEPCEESSLTVMYEKFIDAMENSGAEIILAEPDYSFRLGNADCTVLAPFNVDSSNENNNSVVMLITAGKTSFLMTGDAEKSVEKQLKEKYPSLDTDILSVGHHGSSTSSSAEFIKHITPELGIISCGLNNRYGHPSSKTIETLDSAHVKYYRTDICGTITVHCTATGYTTETEE